MIVDRIGGAGVLGQRAVVEIEPARRLVDRHILEHGSRALGGGVDLRLGVRRQPDDLGIAAALEIEDAVGRPAMFVIADEGPAGIGRQRRLAGARKAEEERRIAPAPWLAAQCIGMTPFSGST